MIAPRTLLRFEGVLVMAVALFLYSRTENPWWLFIVLILVPNLSILGYLAGPRVGAIVYNLVHSYMLPALLAIYGLWTTSQLITGLSLIWFAHIGADRAVGFGLKYPTAFGDHHLQRI